MRNLRKYNPILRAVGVIGVVAGLVTAVTFAVSGGLTTTASLTNNSISSATASLLVLHGSGTPISNTDTGFAFSNIVPGGPASGPDTFTLKNAGSVDLGVTVYATSSTVTGTLDNSKVHFCFTRVTGGPSTSCFTYASMLANFNTLPGGTITTGSGNIEYTVSVNMDSGAVTGSSASIGNFDMVFTGTQQ
jgi:hypothetical protein